MLDHLFHGLIEFMRVHPAWAGFMTFWIALLESLPIFGYLLPGSLILTGIGLLIGAKFIPMWSITLSAIAGAIVGDGLSFLLGKHYHANIRQLWIFKRYIKWLDNGEEFFAKHGGKSVFLGRFFGPLRPMIPMIAGMMDTR
jgi:membrane protein DedA with SNARE-associated domain